MVDGGATPVGVESTILKVEEGRVRLLRPGGVAAIEAEAVAGVPLSRGAKGVEAPGMLASHYAPGAAVRLNAGSVTGEEALLAGMRADGFFVISGSSDSAKSYTRHASSDA